MKQKLSPHDKKGSSNSNYDASEEKRHARFIREFFHHTMLRAHGNNAHSKIEDDTLFVQVALPGVEKSSIKVRARKNKVEVNATRKKDVFLYPHSEAHKILDLEHDIIPEDGDATYSDGILTVKFKLLQTVEQLEEKI